jgi:hypothetical protein
MTLSVEEQYGRRTLDSAALAEVLGWHVKTVERRARTGELPIPPLPRRPGQRYAWAARAVDRYLERTR